LLQRRHIRIGHVRFIGKESNSLEDVESGMVHSAVNVYTEYPNPRWDEWVTVVLPALRNIRASEIVKETGLSRMAVYKLLTERSRPHPKNREMIAKMLRKLGLEGPEN